MLDGGELASFIDQRYAGWRTESARTILEGAPRWPAIAMPP